LSFGGTEKFGLVFKRVADVVEVLFPRLISEAEKEGLREQA